MRIVISHPLATGPLTTIPGIRTGKSLSCDRIEAKGRVEGMGDGATRPEHKNAVADIWFHCRQAFCVSFSIRPGRGQFAMTDGSFLRSRKTNCDVAVGRRRSGLICSSSPCSDFRLNQDELLAIEPDHLQYSA